MKRKIRVTLRIKFDSEHGLRNFVRRALNPWKFFRKRYPEIRISPIKLINVWLGNLGNDDPYCHYIDFNDYDKHVSPYFWIKEILYEKKN